MNPTRVPGADARPAAGRPGTPPSGRGAAPPARPPRRPRRATAPAWRRRPAPARTAPARRPRGTAFAWSSSPAAESTPTTTPPAPSRRRMRFVSPPGPQPSSTTRSAGRRASASSSCLRRRRRSAGPGCRAGGRRRRTGRGRSRLALAWRDCRAGCAGRERRRPAQPALPKGGSTMESHGKVALVTGERVGDRPGHGPGAGEGRLRRRVPRNDRCSCSRRVPRAVAMSHRTGSAEKRSVIVYASERSHSELRFLRIWCFASSLGRASVRSGRCGGFVPGTPPKAELSELQT